MAVQSDAPVRTVTVWCPEWPVVAARAADEHPTAVVHAQADGKGAKDAKRSKSNRTDTSELESEERSVQLPP